MPTRNKRFQLAANNERDSFVAGPCVFQSGVSLRIDRDVTLYASHHYDKPGGAGLCGVNAEKGVNASPLFASKGRKVRTCMAPA